MCAVSRVVLSLLVRSQKDVKTMRRKRAGIAFFFFKKDQNPKLYYVFEKKGRRKKSRSCDSRVLCVCVCVRFRTQKRNERQRRGIWRRNTSATRCSTRSSVRKGTSCASIATRPTRSGRRRRFACSCVSIAPGCTDRSECTSRR